MSSDNRRRSEFLLLAAALVFVPSTASADAIIPYMAVTFGRHFLLPLVVIVEAVVLRFMLDGSFLDILAQSFAANLASTLVGVGFEVVTFQVFGSLDDTLFSWYFDGAFGTQAVRNAILALGFAAFLFAVSWLTESWVLCRLRKSAGIRDVLWPCAMANVVTYAALVALAMDFQR